MFKADPQFFVTDFPLFGAELPFSASRLPPVMSPIPHQKKTHQQIASKVANLSVLNTSYNCSNFPQRGELLPPAKWSCREVYIQSRARVSVHCLDLFILGPVPLPSPHHTGPTSNMFKLVYFDLTIQGTTAAPSTDNGWKVGSLHSTEKPSCS